MEDNLWLRVKIDKKYINVVELDVVVKGFIFVIEWGLSRVVIVIDSKIVVGWFR